MTLIKSISGIRGTIGGGAGVGLNPLDIVKFTSAYATLIRKTCTVKSNKIVVGRDARISGEMVKNVVVGTLMGMGWDVVDIDLASTPTTELAVTMEGASGGIILTASHNPLSSTRALRDVTRKYGKEYFASAVGEVNVTTKMKEVGAVIGGEGNGGVIYPESHYGRDALVGIALFLSHLAHEGKKVSELRATYPAYFMAKNRVDLTPETDVDAILAKVKELYKDEEINDIDGVKIDFADKWVHLRKSNTEPIIRVYSEASTAEAAEEIGQKIMKVIEDLAK